MDVKKDVQKKQFVSNDEVKKLKEELEKSKKETDDFKNKYLRALADYQNYEKRAQTEKEQVGSNAIIFFVLKLLPFLDNLDKAEIFIKDPGLKMIKDSFLNVLKEAGLEELGLLEKQFDPHSAEAIEVVEGEKDNEVVEVLRKGYVFKGKLIRPAQVRVSKKAAKNIS